MLSAADADLVRRDPGLPGLGLLLDPEAVLQRLRRLRPGEDFQHVRAVYARYKPHTSCLVAYRARGAAGEIDVHATARRLEAADKLGRARARAERSPDGLFVLEECSLVVSFFPHDRKLKALDRLVDGRRRRQLLRHALPGRPDLWVTMLTPLRYKPERRWVAQLGSAAEPVATLRVYAAAGFEAGRAAGHAFASRPPLRVARPLGNLESHRFLVMEWIRGQLLGQRIADGTAAPGELALAGQALAALHGQEPRGLAARTRADEARQLQSAAAAVGFTCPRLAEQAETLTRRLVARLAEWPWRPRPIHGDFYAPQVLLSDGSAAVIDLDRAALGDPSVDLGTFLAHLEREVCAGRLPDGYSTQMTDALLEGYGRGAERPGTEDVTTQAAAALLRLAQQPFREREPDWPTQTAALLTRAEDLLDERTRFVSLPAGHSRTRVWNPW